MKRIAFFVGLGVLVAGTVVWVASRPATAPPPTNPAQEVSCKPGELTAVTHRDFAPGPGAVSPETALADYLTSTMPSVDRAKLVRLPSATEEEARFAYTADGKTVAVFTTDNPGMGWRLSGWTACESFVDEHPDVSSS